MPVEYCQCAVVFVPGGLDPGGSCDFHYGIVSDIFGTPCEDRNVIFLELYSKFLWINLFNSFIELCSVREKSLPVGVLSGFYDFAQLEYSTSISVFGFLKTIIMEANAEKDCSVLGNLFQTIVSDLRVSKATSYISCTQL